MLTRRTLISGLGGILAASSAPAFCLSPKSLMRLDAKVWQPPRYLLTGGPQPMVHGNLVNITMNWDDGTTNTYCDHQMPARASGVKFLIGTNISADRKSHELVFVDTAEQAQLFGRTRARRT